MGKHAVGKCMIPGMFDPKIPNALKTEMKKDTNHMWHISARQEEQPERISVFLCTKCMSILKQMICAFDNLEGRKE